MSPRTRAELAQHVAAGHHVDFVCFWGHTPRRPGVADRACFSQWFDSPFEVKGVRYATAEHWMMAQKARCFGDDDVLAQVLAAPTPQVAKRLGREVRGYDDAVWAARRFADIVDGNLAKFSQRVELGAVLLATGDAVLVEAAPNDVVWGVGLSATSPDARTPSKWRGQNLLGFALMTVRDALSKAGSSIPQTRREHR